MQPQQYIRPTNDKPLTPPEKKELLQAYFSHYESVAHRDADSLNVKLPRAAVADVLDQVGRLLLERPRQLALDPGPMREFLEATEPPECLGGRLPVEFRAFSLLLNALKQWVSAESAGDERDGQRVPSIFVDDAAASWPRRRVSKLPTDDTRVGPDDLRV